MSEGVNFPPMRYGSPSLLTGRVGGWGSSLRTPNTSKRPKVVHESSEPALVAIRRLIATSLVSDLEVSQVLRLNRVRWADIDRSNDTRNEERSRFDTNDTGA